MAVGNNERRLTAELCVRSKATIRNHIVNSDCYVSINDEGFILQRVLIRGIRLGNAESTKRGMSLLRMYRLIEMCANYSLQSVIREVVNERFLITSKP